MLVLLKENSEQQALIFFLHSDKTLQPLYEQAHLSLISDRLAQFADEY
jgi:hypothetical protein